MRDLKDEHGRAREEFRVSRRRGSGGEGWIRGGARGEGGGTCFVSVSGGYSFGLLKINLG